MIINYLTDNDLYKFTTMNAIQKLYPNAIVKYRFFNRGNTEFPKGFAAELKKEADAMANLALTCEEEEFIKKRCYFFDPVYVDLLKGYRYNPGEVKISQQDGKLELEVVGPWYRSVLWEVPLMAIISELYFKLTNQKPQIIEEKAEAKALKFKDLKADYSEFGTRRRFSFDVHDRVVSTLIENSGSYFKGSSNIYFAMKYNVTPIGTHPHEWFMYHAAHFGYRMANHIALNKWVDVYKGDLGIALSDTFTTDSFFKSFTSKHAKLFDGVRWDSGDPYEFTEKTINFYTQNRIDPKFKTIVYSDSLNLEGVERIKSFVNGRIHDAYGIGTFLTNDVGVKPLNMVIKIVSVKIDKNHDFVPAIKLSDALGKHTGDESEIDLCMRMLGIKRE